MPRFCPKTGVDMRFEVRHSEVWLVPVLLQSAHVMLVMPMCSLSHKRTRGRRHANEKMEKTPPHRPAAFLTQKPLVASQHPRSFLDPKGGDMGYATQRQNGPRPQHMVLHQHWRCLHVAVSRHSRRFDAELCFGRTGDNTLLADAE